MYSSKESWASFLGDTAASVSMGRELVAEESLVEAAAAKNVAEDSNTKQYGDHASLIVDTLSSACETNCPCGHQPMWHHNSPAIIIRSGAFQGLMLPNVRQAVSRLDLEVRKMDLGQADEIDCCVAAPQILRELSMVLRIAMDRNLAAGTGSDEWSHPSPTQSSFQPGIKMQRAVASNTASSVGPSPRCQCVPSTTTRSRSLVAGPRNRASLRGELKRGLNATFSLAPGMCTAGL